MGRFDPPAYVTDRSGEILAHAISQAFATMAQNRRQKQQDAAAAEDRQRAQAVQNYSLGREGVSLTGDRGEGLTRGIPFAELGTLAQNVDVTPGLPENVRIGDLGTGAALARTVSPPASSPAVPSHPPGQAGQELAAALTPDVMAGGAAAGGPSMSSMSSTRPTPPSGVPGSFVSGLGFHSPRSAMAAPPAPVSPTMVTPQRSARYEFGDGFLVDRDKRAATRAQDQAASFEAALAKAMAETQGKQLGDPEGVALGRRKTQSEITRNLRDPSRNPVVGSPEWKEAKRFEAGLRPEPQTHFTFTTGTDDEGKPVVVAGNTRTGEVRPTQVGRPATGNGGRGTATIQKAVASNTQQLAVIDDALRELDAYPDAVGLTRGLPLVGDRLDQRVNPKGVAARASIANIGSLQIHDRSGAAVTVHEMPRLAPFVPSVGDTPEAIRTKLRKLKETIQVETQALQRGAPPSPRASGAPAPSNTPGTQGGQTITLNGKQFILPPD